VTAPSEYFATDEKGDAPFGDMRGIGPAERDPTYQGEYHDYAGGDWINMKARPQVLYEYHVPGAGTSAEYLGGDGGLDSDYDAVTAPSEYFATDEKGDAPFGDMRGIGPAERDPTYQGEYHDYAGGDWINMKARPQQLMQVPAAMVMRDAAGQLRLVNPRAIQGLQLERLAQLHAQRRMASQIASVRRQREVVHAAKAGASKATAKSSEHATAAAHAAKKDGRLEMLAQKEAFGSSKDRIWGKVYEPQLVKISGLYGPRGAQAPLSGAAAKEFKRWDKLAEKVTSVYDPTKSDFENSASEMAPGGNWWSAPKFEGHNAKTDKWWVHSNAHSKNKAF